MITSLKSSELKNYLFSQLYTFFPDSKRFSGKDTDSAMDLALERTEECFRHILLKGYRNESGEATFSHMHSDQYSQFLYFYSNSLWSISQNNELCSKIINLNKCLNGMFFSYKGCLPDHFLFAHPVGTVLGNAAYSDCLVVFQNVTVNTSESPDGSVAPKLGKGLFLGAGAKIIGSKTIGNRVSIGVNAVVMDQDIPDDSVVVADVGSGRQIIRARNKKNCMAQNYFDIPLV